MEYKLVLPGQTDYKWTERSHLTLEYLKSHAVGNVFVETGTYMGDTVKLALEYGFKEIHSIELNDELYEAAVEMFKDVPNVYIWHGDSYNIMPKIIGHIGDQPATFWLDAHASGPLTGGESGGSPVVHELKIIAESSYKKHTIFIDDRRLFGSAEWSFVKFEDAINALKNINENYVLSFLDGHIPEDVICAEVL